MAIHTLASASHEIIHTLFKRKGLKNLMFDADVIRDEYRGEFGKFMRKAATFFKHAQRDPDAELDFDPRLNELLLLMSAFGLERMKVPLGIPEAALMNWYHLHFPEFFSENVFAERLPPESLEELRQIPKREFFETFALDMRKRGAV